MEMTCEEFCKFKQQGKCSAFSPLYYSPFPKPLLGGEMKKSKSEIILDIKKEAKNDVLNNKIPCLGKRMQAQQQFPAEPCPQCDPRQEPGLSSLEKVALGQQ